MTDRVRDAAQHPRLHATAPAGAENDDVGVDVGCHGEDRAADVVVAIGDARQRDEAGGNSPMRAVGGDTDAALSSAASVSPSPYSPINPNPMPSEPLPVIVSRIVSQTTSAVASLPGISNPARSVAACASADPSQQIRIIMLLPAYAVPTECRRNSNLSRGLGAW